METKPEALENMSLIAETLALARKFEGEAKRLDKVFVEGCNPRVLKDGAICAEANVFRSFGKKLLLLSHEMLKAESENDLLLTVPSLRWIFSKWGNPPRLLGLEPPVGNLTHEGKKTNGKT